MIIDKDAIVPVVKHPICLDSKFSHWGNVGKE